MASIDSDRQCRPATIVAGLLAIAQALDNVAHAIHRLGNADACTPMGPSRPTASIRAKSWTA
ncbi:MAG TPA: hypothetical protein VNK48_02070 [Xanthobacteraceae bacterium]|nr:hypothetical protein [Xanthobacteraceae bacterium]